LPKLGKKKLIITSTQVLDVLVEKIQNPATDDFAVLMLGYEGPMRKMLRDQNPGLARRFPIDQVHALSKVTNIFNFDRLLFYHF
jgi:hypothetical protein